MKKELQGLINDIGTWSDKEFGTGDTRIIPIINHLKKELEELREAHLDLEFFKRNFTPVGINNRVRCEEELNFEFADCFMLLFDAARIVGLSVEDIIRYMSMKLQINKQRDWTEADSGGIVEHQK